MTKEELMEKSLEDLVDMVITREREATERISELEGANKQLQEEVEKRKKEALAFILGTSSEPVKTVNQEELKYDVSKFL